MLVLVVVSVDCSMLGSFLVCSLCLRCLIYARWLLVWCRWSSVCCSCVLFAGLWFFGACSFVVSCLMLLLSLVLVVRSCLACPVAFMVALFLLVAFVVLLLVVCQLPVL